jgi:uncharacterized membrane protein
MRTILRFLLLSSLLLFTVILGSRPALAQEGQTAPPQDPPGLTVFTKFPAQEAAIGENVTFALTVRNGSAPDVVRLQLQDLPDGWNASFKGGGRVIQAAYVEPQNAASVDLRLEPPRDVKAGTYQFTVVGAGNNNQEIKLPLELTIKDKVPPSMTFEVELPTLRGTPDTTFRYNVTLKNEGDADLTVNLLAEAPKGLEVSFKLTGQDVTNIPLAANESKRLSVEAKPFPDLPAGSYPIKITAQGGETETALDLTAEVTGQPNLTVTAPDGRLSGQAYVGETSPIKLVVQNTGSAPARNIQLSASPPNGWKVEFEPKQIDEVPSGQQVEVTANLQPANQAVAGDYVVTVRAAPEDGPTESADFRITVLTSTLWGVVGIALIAVAVAVVGLAVSRFGRR